MLLCYVDLRSKMTTLNEWNVESIRIEKATEIYLYGDTYKVSYDTTSKNEYIEFESITGSILEFDLTEIRKKLKPYHFKFLSIFTKNNCPSLRFTKNYL